MLFSDEKDITSNTFSSNLSYICSSTICLSTIVSKPADNCRQVCRQLSTGLPTVIDKRLPGGKNKITGGYFRLPAG